MKKKFIFILLLVFISGCDADYTVDLTSDTFYEDMYLYTDNDTFVEKTSTEEGIQEIGTEMYRFDKDFHNYKSDLKFDEKNAGFLYQTNFKLKNSSWPTLASQCYDKIEVAKNKNNITIQTSNEFLCYEKYPYLNSVSIALKTDYISVDNNADRIESGKYIWEISEEESTYKPLYIKLQTQKVQKKDPQSMIVPTAIITLSIITLIFSIVFIKRRKKNNDF